MKKTTDYLNEIVTRYKIVSFQDLADRLKISRQAVHEQLKGASAMKPYQAVKAAALLDISPFEVIAATQAERAKDKEEIAVWTAIYDNSKRPIE